MWAPSAMVRSSRARGPSLCPGGRRLRFPAFAACMTGGLVCTALVMLIGTALFRMSRPPGTRNPLLTPAGPPLAVPIGLPAWAVNVHEVATLGGAFSRAYYPWLFYTGAQFGEDSRAYKSYFYGRGGGTFLELGAVNGVWGSGSLPFERELGWRGVLIEPAPDMCARDAHMASRIGARSTYAFPVWAPIPHARTVMHGVAGRRYAELVTSRPLAITVNAAVCATPGVLHYTTTGNMCCRGIVEFMPPKALAEHHSQIASGEVRLEDISTLHCVPLRHILRQVGITHINWWILDVEGAEAEVLASTDFAAVTFDVITVEASGLNKTKDARVHAMLDRAGFRYDGHDGIMNDWFVNRQFVPSARPL